MGLKDLFKKMYSESLEPRPLHYSFAHEFLPNMVYLGKIEYILQLILDEGATKYIQELWEIWAKKLNIPLEDSSELAIQHYLIDDIKIIIFKFPPPIAPTEVFYSALVLKDKIHYYTYENMKSINGGFKTSFCGWSSPSEHETYGPGGAKSVEYFLMLIKNHLETL